MSKNRQLIYVYQFDEELKWIKYCTWIFSGTGASISAIDVGAQSSIEAGLTGALVLHTITVLADETRQTFTHSSMVAHFATSTIRTKSQLTHHLQTNSYFSTVPYNKPMLHFRTSSQLVALLSVVNFPPLHSSHMVEASLTLKKFVGQGVQGVRPVGEYSPGRQRVWHWLTKVEPDVSVYVPAGQAVQFLYDPGNASEETLSLGHARQGRTPLGE